MNQANDPGAQSDVVAGVDNMYDRFNRDLARALAIAGGAIIPVGLIVSGALGGLRGLAGGLVGFGVASLYSVAALWGTKWALEKPLEKMPLVMMGMFVARLVVVACVLYGLTFATAINRYAIFGCFVALFLAYTTLEIVYAWKTFGTLLHPPE
ncbi:MAG: hypothetical protein ACYC99_13800 [Candidatus Geothermincolia bacterium]